MKKTGGKKYEVHLSAKIDDPWHIYSQATPAGGPVPTKISFMKNPLVTINGAVREVGKMNVKREEVFGVDVKYYDGTVDFVQDVSLRPNVRRSLNGTVTFMVCNDQSLLAGTGNECECFRFFLCKIYH